MNRVRSLVSAFDSSFNGYTWETTAGIDYVYTPRVGVHTGRHVIGIAADLNG